MKEQVKAEILAILRDAIDDEIALSGGFLTVMEIAREVLLQAPELAKV